jgi:pyruvate/2-oxoglutarate dehydrogenase complex dihydrolipoamide acyltransferase (E2) component
MSKRATIPVAVPELGSAGRAVEVVQWLVDESRAVSVGDRIVELLADGVVFHLTSERSGRLERIERDRGAVVSAGETLAWLEAADAE